MRLCVICKGLLVDSVRNLSSFDSSSGGLSHWKGKPEMHCKTQDYYFENKTKPLWKHGSSVLDVSRVRTDVVNVAEYPSLEIRRPSSVGRAVFRRPHRRRETLCVAVPSVSQGSFTSTGPLARQGKRSLRAMRTLQGESQRAAL